jgi:hypothetical protein
MSQIREQIRQMKEEYEARIKALERPLSEAEAKAGKAGQQAGKAQAAAPLTCSSDPPLFGIFAQSCKEGLTAFRRRK